jgi:hypothetical protein
MHWMKAWLDNLSAVPASNAGNGSTAEQATAEDEHALQDRIARLERRIAELESVGRAER